MMPVMRSRAMQRRMQCVVGIAYPLLRPREINIQTARRRHCILEIYHAETLLKYCDTLNIHRITVFPNVFGSLDLAQELIILYNHAL